MSPIVMSLRGVSLGKNLQGKTQKGPGFQEPFGETGSALLAAAKQSHTDQSAAQQNIGAGFRNLFVGRDVRIGSE